MAGALTSCRAKACTRTFSGGHLFPFGGVRKSGLWLRSAVEDVRREEEASSRALS
jgi:hypothetical protein